MARSRKTADAGTAAPIGLDLGADRRDARGLCGELRGHEVVSTGQGGDSGAPEVASRPQGPAPEGMVWIPGGTFQMGCDSPFSWPNEQPAHRVRVDGFWLDVTEVTNVQFREFVDATGYLTTAEKAPTVAEILAQLPPGTPPPASE